MSRVAENLKKVDGEDQVWSLDRDYPGALRDAGLAKLEMRGRESKLSKGCKNQSQ